MFLRQRGPAPVDVWLVVARVVVLGECGAVEAVLLASDKRLSAARVAEALGLDDQGPPLVAAAGEALNCLNLLLSVGWHDVRIVE